MSSNSYKKLEMAIEQGHFDLFCEVLKSLPPNQYPEIKLRPKLGLITRSQENPHIYSNLLNLGCNPAQALDLSKRHLNLEDALKEFQYSN